MKEEASQDAKDRFHRAKLILDAAMQDESFELYVDWTPDSNTELKDDKEQT